jgi:serine protease AprX
VIVQYKSPASGAPSARCSNKLLDLPGGSLCSVTAREARTLAQDASVAHVSVNHSLQATGSALPVYDYTPETIHPQSQVAAGTPDFKAGKKVGVAVIDSGISINQDLGSIVSYAQSFVPGEGVDDYYGHGTHIAGIIAGNGSSSAGSSYLEEIHGISPGVSLINLKVLDQNGQSTDAEVIEAIDTAILLKDIYNIQVINLSLGRPIYESFQTDPLCQAVEQAWQAGITVVVAAGNGDGCRKHRDTRPSRRRETIRW